MVLNSVLLMSSLLSKILCKVGGFPTRIFKYFCVEP